VPLRVSLDGDAAVRVVADRWRRDLPDDGFAFEAWLPVPPAADVPVEIAVQTEDGTHLPGSPVRLAAAVALAIGPHRPDAGPPLALVVDEAAPDPAQATASAAVLSHMRALRHLGFSVVFSTLAEAQDALRRTAGRVRVAYLRRLRPMALLNAQVRALNPGVHVLFGATELVHRRAERQAALRGEAAPTALRTAELAAARAADAVLTFSQAEAGLLERSLPGVRAHWVPWVITAAPVAEPFAARVGIGFPCGDSDPAELDAAQVLLDEIMPAVWARAPLRCVIAGGAMPKWLRRRAGGLVEVIASPPDAAALWRRVRVGVAPHRFGAGVAGSVLDGIAAGIPCVCSPVAAEGLPLPPPLVAADRGAMVAALLALHADHAWNGRIAADALGRLGERYAADVVERALAWALMPG
jgi:hypothetical protein